MSFEEKSTWIMAVITPLACAAYLLTVLPRLQSSSVDQVACEWPLVATVIAAIVASIVAHVVAAALAPRDAERRDERDAHIGRFGAYVGSFVLAVGVANALVLALARCEHFWIANAIYLTLVLADVTSSAVKIVGYRRGF